MSIVVVWEGAEIEVSEERLEEFDEAMRLWWRTGSRLARERARELEHELFLIPYRRLYGAPINRDDGDWARTSSRYKQTP